MGLFIGVYLAAVALGLSTSAWAWRLASRDRSPARQLFFFYVVANDLVAMADLLFRLFPDRLSSPSQGSGPAFSGFLVVPLLAAFSILAVLLFAALAGRPLSRRRAFALVAYWALLFLGFLAAEFREFAYADPRLTALLQPAFNASIVASGLVASAWGFLSARRLGGGERTLVRKMGAYFFVTFVAFGWLFYSPLRLDPDALVAARALLGQAYLIVPLAWLAARTRAAGGAPLTRPEGTEAAVERWLEAAGLSPREREIARRALDGRRSSEIGKELFIGRRTVESHLYSAYRKLGVRNRLQLARRAAEAAARADRP